MTNFKTISTTKFNFPNQEAFYKGKVRDVYNINNKLLVMIATDRISAFDVVLPKAIPFKGQILNQIAAKMLKATQDIVPNWLLATPDPNVAVGLLCEPFKVEMVIRGYLTGHAARTYNEGKRELCGVKLPEGMKENQKFEKPIITPSTKAADGAHDEDISKAAIIANLIVSKEDYEQLEKYTYLLFQRGTELAKERGLILVDTKYEFGKTKDGKIVLIDEIHTPDSSRYFYADGYADRFKNDEPQKQLSKEFVRQWLIEKGFQGKEGQQVPEMTDEKVLEISNRYIELYEQITGEAFVKSEETDLLERIEKNINLYLESI
ncbi:MAG: phosphoribosylaminoimidazolesuccinocarboxamide synthase [Flavobacteriaceae bacterium]|nr:phosphoribosylaminoimidazolesuccinocarboxamide synthase [Flavobacteriaceae bacterium]